MRLRPSLVPPSLMRANERIVGSLDSCRITLEGYHAGKEGSAHLPNGLNEVTALDKNGDCHVNLFERVQPQEAGWNVQVGGDEAKLYRRFDSVQPFLNVRF